MADFSEDFLRFLKANFPDDYLRATSADLPDDVKQSIMSRQEGHYKVWSHIPEWIKNEYADRLPREVLYGNVAVKEFVEKEEDRFLEQEEETKALMKYSASMLALGYAVETASVLAENHVKRLELMKQAQGGKLSETALAEWLKTRESDENAILTDWKTHQREKYLVHLLKEINRNDKRMQKAETENGKAVFGMKKSALDRELRGLINECSSKNDKEKLINYLRGKSQQGAMRHISPEILAEFGDLLNSQGIKIKLSSEDDKVMDVRRMNLFESMKQHFTRRKDLIESLQNQSVQGNEDFMRAEIPGMVNHSDTPNKVKDIVQAKMITHENNRA